MDRELKYPARQSGYAGDEEPSFPQPGPPIRQDGLPASQNRGKRAPQEGSGVVIGSGASSGGAGNEEDYDSDAVGGGGALPGRGSDDNPKRGADAPIGGSR